MGEVLFPSAAMRSSPLDSYVCQTSVQCGGSVERGSGGGGSGKLE